MVFHYIAAQCTVRPSVSGRPVLFAGIHIHTFHFIASFALSLLRKICKNLSKRLMPEQWCAWVILSFSCSLIFTPEFCICIHFKSGAGVSPWWLLHSLGRWEWPHHPHHIALAKRNECTTRCIPQDCSGSSYIKTHICVTQHFSATDLQQSYLHTVCVACCGSHHTASKGTCPPKTLQLGAAMSGIAPCPCPSVDLHWALTVSVT